MLWRPSFQKRMEIRRRKVKSMVSNCSEMLMLARIGRPDIQWSVINFARSITKWTKACDKRLSRLIAYIHHTCEYRQYCHSSHMWIQAILSCGKHCRKVHIGTVSRLRFCRRSWGLKNNFRCKQYYAFFESHTFVPISWMCRKQTSVSHSSTESESFPWMHDWGWTENSHFDSWDLIVAVLQGNTHQNDQVRGDPYKCPTPKKTHGKIDDLNNVDSFSSNVNSSCEEAVLYIFEDNFSMIKMVIKGRSLAMRHVSRTHRFALGWLFDWINLDPKIQIKYIDTKNQLADILTKGNFTHDEWSPLLCQSQTDVEQNTRRCRWRRKSHSKNQSRWWIWYHDTVWGIRMC